MIKLRDVLKLHWYLLERDRENGKAGWLQNSTKMNLLV